jgi:hypothetical protein
MAIQEGDRVALMTIETTIAAITGVRDIHRCRHKASCLGIGTELPRPQVVHN